MKKNRHNRNRIRKRGRGGGGEREREKEKKNEILKKVKKPENPKKEEKKIKIWFR